MVPRPIHVQGPSLGPVSVRGCLQRQMPPAGQGRLSLQALPVGSVRDIKSMILGRPKRRLPRSSLHLFARIVAWSANNYTTVLPDLELPFRGRLADLARPILQVAELGNPNAQQPIIEVLSEQDRERRVDTAESWEARVAIALWESREEILTEGRRVYISCTSTAPRLATRGGPDLKCPQLRYHFLC